MGRDTPADDSAACVDRVFCILEYLEDRGGAEAAAVASHLGLSAGTTADYLESLRRRSYVVETDGEYRVGLRFLELGDAVQRSERAYRLAEPQVDLLAEETGERANFIVEEHGKGVFVHRATGANAVETDTHLGKRIFLHATGAGKAILANLPPERVDAVVEDHGLVRRTENTVTDRDALEAALSDVRERGYAFNDEEGTRGLRSVGVPVTTPEGRLVGALSVSGPSYRLKGEYFRRELPELILGCANELELRLAYS